MEVGSVNISIHSEQNMWPHFIVVCMVGNCSVQMEQVSGEGTEPDLEAGLLMAEGRRLLLLLDVVFSFLDLLLDFLEMLDRDDVGREPLVFAAMVMPPRESVESVWKEKVLVGVGGMPSMVMAGGCFEAKA